MNNSSSSLNFFKLCQPFSRKICNFAQDIWVKCELSVACSHAHKQKKSRVCWCIFKVQVTYAMKRKDIQQFLPRPLKMPLADLLADSGEYRLICKIIKTILNYINHPVLFWISTTQFPKHNTWLTRHYLRYIAIHFQK